MTKNNQTHSNSKTQQRTKHLLHPTQPNPTQFSNPLPKMDPTFTDDDNDNSSLNDDDSLLPPDFYTTAIPSESSSDSRPDPPPPTAVTIAIPSTTTSATAVALPEPKPSRQPIEDSRRLFQRLWTDEDEIELLRGFLDYTSSRGGLHHHHDSSAFYDIIKSKLQLDFNKNQLVEKLRRLKKKYRTVLAKMNSGKEFAFKSPHDHITFKLSSKIWSYLKPNGRGGGDGNGNGGDFDDDDPNPNPNASGSGVIVAVTPPSGGYYVGHVNLNNSGSGSGSVTPVVEQKPNLGTIVPHVGSPLKLSTRKRERVKVERMDDRFVRANLGQTGGAVGGGGGNGGAEAVNVNVNSSNLSNISNNNSNSNAHVGPGIQGMIEETVRNCLSPVLKELINTAVNVNASMNSNVDLSGVSGGRANGVGALAYNAMPSNFSGVNFENSGELMHEKWRNQQILELEVYSKRLELIQDQIKLTLDELGSMGG